MSSTYDRACNGEYDSKLAYSYSKPAKPAILLKRVGDLTSEEIATVPQVKKEYEDAVTAHSAAREAYHADQQRLTQKFQSDLEAEHGLSGHPRAAMLYAKAYDIGHSGGLAEVAIHYNEMAELIVGTTVVV